MDRGAWRATVHGVAESDMTEHRFIYIERETQETKRQRQRERKSVYRALHAVGHDCALKYGSLKEPFRA